MENGENRKPQPILIKLESSKKDKQKKTIIILCIIIVLLLAGFLFYYYKQQKAESDKAPENVKDPSDTLITSELTTKETDPYAFIYETTLPTYIDKKGVVHQVTEDFDPEENEKVEDYFGPLPESEHKADFEHQKIRGVYIYDTDYLDSLLEEVKGTEVNALVIDVKESYGVLYDSKIPLVKELNCIIANRDIKGITEKCHANGIRVIARIVSFKDETFALVRPDLCIQNEDGIPIQFPHEGNATWANPYNQEVWQYLIDVAEEVIDLGVDEIQFDYIRFPAGGSLDGSAAYYGEPDTVPKKLSAINRFLQTAAIQIQDKDNIPIGADLFSIVMTSDLDGHAIGQDWKSIGLTGIDNICPMIYPSHYANGAPVGYAMANGVGTDLGDNRYTAPDLEPYGVVTDAIIDGREAIDQEGYAHVRPYLQAFTASYLPQGYWMEYNGPVIRKQMEAVYDSGFDEWILWNVNPSYPSGTFAPKEKE
ncbi:MAG TPA: GTP-binding protein [Clostridiaceae bacterium]|mgnify:CR=1 FL=1|nr:GTP-binding protein [Clostridiaceae bacterium]